MKRVGVKGLRQAAPGDRELVGELLVGPTDLAKRDLSRVLPRQALVQRRGVLLVCEQQDTRAPGRRLLAGAALAAAAGPLGLTTPVDSGSICLSANEHVPQFLAALF